MAKEKFTIGTDPEMFGKEKKTGKYRSMIPFLEGTKYKPEMLPTGAGLQRDNVALEFASPPAKNEMDFVKNLQETFLHILSKKVPKDLELTVEPSANFDEDQLDHPEAVEFGCSPDYDAYGPGINPPASCDDPSFRSCGGHVHLGYVEGSGNDFLLDDWGKINTILAMDVFLGIPSVMLDCSEAAIKRRQLYGKAGCHRPTDYGVEYRTLSNYWLKSPELVMLVYRLSCDVLRAMREDRAGNLVEEIGRDRIREIINEGKVGDAKKVLAENIRPHLSEDTEEILEICIEKAGKYDNFLAEWDIQKELEKEA